jgi:hypothetical protein
VAWVHCIVVPACGTPYEFCKVLRRSSAKCLEGSSSPMHVVPQGTFTAFLHNCPCMQYYVRVNQGGQLRPTTTRNPAYHGYHQWPRLRAKNSRSCFSVRTHAPVPAGSAATLHKSLSLPFSERPSTQRGLILSRDALMPAR